MRMAKMGLAAHEYTAFGSVLFGAMDRLRYRSRTLILACAFLAACLQVEGAAVPAVVNARNLAPAQEFPAQNQPGEDRLTSPALPVLNTVLGKVLERARQEDQNDRAFQAHYAFKRSKLAEERDGQGKLEKRHENDNPHSPAPEPAAVEPKPTPGPAKPSLQSNRTSKRPMDRKDFPLNQELLNHFQFTLVRREMLHDRPALVLDFKPAHSRLPAMSLKDYFLSRVAGRVWIDEVDWALVQADVHQTQPATVAAGLIGAVKGLCYHFDRERTLEGYWFTKAVKWHVELRELLAHKTLDYAEETKDVTWVR